MAKSNQAAQLKQREAQQPQGDGITVDQKIELEKLMVLRRIADTLAIIAAPIAEELGLLSEPEASDETQPEAGGEEE